MGLDGLAKKAHWEIKRQYACAAECNTRYIERSAVEYVLTRAVDDPLYAATFEARDEYWKTIGKIDEDVIAHVMSPEFMGAPAWPTTRQAYKIIRTDKTVIIASDGLSDPFTDCAEHEVNMNGFGSEVYIESSELVGASFDEIAKSWQFEAIEIWARNVANYGGINFSVEKYGVFSTELPVGGIPEDWVSPSGNVGLLVNVKPKDNAIEITDMPLAPIKIIPLTIIRPDELAFIVAGGQDGRDSLALQLGEAGFYHISDANRQSVLD